MSQGWENHEAAPIEFLHGRLMDLFHEYRRSTVGQENLSASMTGNEFNNIIAKAKTETYKKYPKQVNSNAILKTDI
jgi:hypothetical protein